MPSSSETVKLNSAFASYFRRLGQLNPLRLSGTVKRAVGLVIESQGPAVSVGELCTLEGRSGEADTVLEVIGFRDSTILLMPLGPMPPVRAGDTVVATGRVAEAPVGHKLLGRIINALGEPLDEHGPLDAEDAYPLHRAATNPLDALAQVIRICVAGGIFRFPNLGTYKAVYDCTDGAQIVREGTGRAPGLIRDPRY